MLAATTPASATFPGRNGAIAYGSCPDCESSEGASPFVSLLPVTQFGDRTYDPWGAKTARFDGGDPAFSASGRLVAVSVGYSSGELAYCRAARHGWCRYVGDVTGRKPAGRVIGRSPAWSSDGRSLAFVRVVHRGTRSIPYIWVVRRDGSGLRRIARGDNPCWSALGLLVFDRDGGIYTMDSRGGNRRRVTSLNIRHASDPEWSPDGTQIVFVAVHNDYPMFSWIYVVRANGSRLRDVTHARAKVDQYPVFSPDGRWIAFGRDSGDEEETQIFRVPRWGGSRS